ncbi:Formin, partial [Blumeria graminis f. sp. tritici 96224]
MSGETKSKAGTSGISFFSRSKQKEKRNTNEEVLGTELDKTKTNTSKSPRSSRHTRNSSSIISTDDSPNSPGADPSGLNMMAGVMTSIPYDSLATDVRSPIPVEYLPRSDQMPQRREPQPHQLNRATADYHQYPSFETPPGSSNGTPQPPGSRSNSTMTMTSSGGKIQTQQWGSGRASGASASSSIYGRSSFDQPNVESATERSSVFSGNSARTGLPHSQSNSSILTNLSPYYSTFKDTNKLMKSAPSYALEASNTNIPSDERIIDEKFLSLMHKRGWNYLPEEAKRQMMAYPPEKKWTLVHQDRLTKYQGESRRTRIAQYGSSGREVDMLANTEEEGTPEWFVKKVMDNTITAKQLQSLAVSLRTQPIGWVKIFVECQGQVALTNVLGKLNRKQAQGPAPVDGSSSEKDLEREYDIVKCLKAVMNNKYGADDALAHQQIIVALTTSLTSPRLTSRKLVSEVLTFLCHWADGEGHRKVIQALDYVKTQYGENGRFDAWMRVVEVTIDGRGKMGSLVGASDELRNGGIGMENLLMEYAVASLILINMMIDAPDKDLQLRVHIRAQFTACGIKRILTKMEGFQYEVIDKQIERFRTNEAIDYEDLLEHENSSMKDSIEGMVKDLDDPVQIVDAIMQKVRGSRTQDYFVSSLQHLLLLRDNQGEERLRMFQLVDSMLSYVAMDRRLPDMDLKQSLNFTVQSLLDKLHTDSEARQALDEAVQARQIADSAIAERDEMRAQIELGTDGVVAKLQKQIDEQAHVIEIQRRQTDALKLDVENIHAVRAKEAQRNELETRELYLMLRDAQEIAASNASKARTGVLADTNEPKSNGIIDREKLMDRLEMLIERQKTQFKLEGRTWADPSGPSDRLRALREEMDGVVPQSESQTIPRSYQNSVLGSVVRQTKVASRQITPDGILIENENEDSKILLESQEEGFRRPDHSHELMDEMKAKVRRYTTTDDETMGTDIYTKRPSSSRIDPNISPIPESRLITDNVDLSKNIEVNNYTATNTSLSSTVSQTDVAKKLNETAPDNDTSTSKSGVSNEIVYKITDAKIDATILDPSELDSYAKLSTTVKNLETEVTNTTVTGYQRGNEIVSLAAGHSDAVLRKDSDNIQSLPLSTIPIPEQTSELRGPPPPPKSLTQISEINPLPPPAPPLPPMPGS